MATASPATTGTMSDKSTYAVIAVFSAVLYTVLLIAPVIAGTLAGQFGLSPTQIGALFSLELGAFSLATVPAYLWLTRVNLRTATYLFTGIVIAGNFLSGFVDSYGPLLITRFITSLAAGSITVILLSLSGKARNPSRAFGVFVVCQLTMGALILAVFPSIYAGAEVSAVYWTLAVLAVFCLPAVRLIDGEFLLRSRNADGTIRAVRPHPVKFTAGLAAVFVFYVALSGVWTFIAQISTAAGIDIGASSIILSVATVAGILSALTATVLGETPRRRVYLLLGYLGMAASVALLFGGPGVIRFAAAAVVFKFAWTFILPYLLSSLSSLGTGGQIMNTTNLMIGGGFAIGPILSGILIEQSGGFTAMLGVALAGVLLSMACALAIQRWRTS